MHPVFVVFLFRSHGSLRHFHVMFFMCHVHDTVTCHEANQVVSVRVVTPTRIYGTWLRLVLVRYHSIPRTHQQEAVRVALEMELRIAATALFDSKSPASREGRYV